MFSKRESWVEAGYYPLGGRPLHGRGAPGWTGYRIIFLVAFFLFLVCGYLFLDFVDGMGEYGSFEEPVDVIVVLTGGAGRIEKGLELMRKGTGKILILSGVNEASDMDAIFFNQPLTDREKKTILLEKISRSTYENAVEVGKLMEGLGMDSMMLITSTYHMKRAMYIFRDVIPDYIRIEPCSVSTPNFDETRWWRGSGPVLCIKEFIKYYWYIISDFVV